MPTMHACRTRTDWRDPGAIFDRALSGTPTVKPAEALMIGDDWQSDVQGALAVGMRAVHFASSDTHNGEVPILQTWHDFRRSA